MAVEVTIAMPLTLRAVSLNDQPLTQPITARFGAEGGTIGRADTNTMALPDPERHISRLQAQIITSDTGFVIKNVGSANPILVRGQPVARGDSSRLSPSDEVRIGGYLLEVVNEGPAPPERAVAWPQVPRPETAPVPPLANGNPFADLLGQGTGPFDDLVGNGASRSIDDVFGLQSGDQDALNAFAESAVKPSATSVDPMAMFEPAATPPTPATTASDHVSQLRTGYRPPKILPPARAIPGDLDWLPAASRDKADVPTVPPLPAPAPEADALWQAFCEGAGVNVDAPRTLDASTMRLIGRMLRGAVEGTHQMMMLRATTKSELGADVTIIHSQRNNPFKFSPDGQAVLEQLLRPPLRGFLPGAEAVTDAMHDLVSHAIGTVAGMRAAMEGMLQRFAPDELEAKLDTGSLLDRVFPMSRHSRLWRLYLQRFETLRHEAQDDFQTLFGKAFVAAYEEQHKRLERSTATRTPDA